MQQVMSGSEMQILENMVASDGFSLSAHLEAQRDLVFKRPRGEETVEQRLFAAQLPSCSFSPSKRQRQRASTRDASEEEQDGDKDLNANTDAHSPPSFRVRRSASPSASVAAEDERPYGPELPEPTELAEDPPAITSSPAAPALELDEDLVPAE